MASFQANAIPEPAYSEAIEYVVDEMERMGIDLYNIFNTRWYIHPNPDKDTIIYKLRVAIKIGSDDYRAIEFSKEISSDYLRRRYFPMVPVK